jgi:hypothetical protein
VSGTSRYCHKCGAELPPGATFCPVCGTPVYVPPPAGSTSQPPPSSTPPPYYDRHAYRQWRREQRRNEKGEKGEKNEKGGEKGEKGSGGRAIIGPLIGGGILIWLGITFYLQQIGYVSGNWWALFILGIGVLLVLQGLLFYGRSHRPFYGPFIGGGILIIIGLSSYYNSIDSLWPLILVVIGIAVLASAFGYRRRTPPPT